MYLFVLNNSGEEVGLDVVNLKVCCGIKRDSMRACTKRSLPSTNTPPNQMKVCTKRTLSSSDTPSNQSHSALADNKKRKTEPNVTTSNIPEGYIADQEGNFTFTVCYYFFPLFCNNYLLFALQWKGSDTNLLNLFVLLKKGYELGETN